MSAPNIYLTEAEAVVLMRESQGRKNSSGGPAMVSMALGTGRLLPGADGSYDQWWLLVLCELRGAEMSAGQKENLAKWRNGGVIGRAR